MLLQNSNIVKYKKFLNGSPIPTDTQNILVYPSPDGLTTILNIPARSRAYRSGTPYQYPQRRGSGLALAATDIWLDFDGTRIEPRAISPTALTEAYMWTYAITHT